MVPRTTAIGPRAGNLCASLGIKLLGEAAVLRFAIAFCLTSAAAFAATWTGALVDSKCYAALERNASPTDTLTNVDRDRYQEVWYCSPTRKTKSFAIVSVNSEEFRFTPAGDQKAADFIRTVKQKPPFVVEVRGERNGDVLDISSITLLRANR